MFCGFLDDSVVRPDWVDAVKGYLMYAAVQWFVLEERGGPMANTYGDIPDSIRYEDDSHDNRCCNNIEHGREIDAKQVIAFYIE